ncbi:MAG: sigma-70 family RNA polymerase sigma factor [Planctomycetales bacterium]|nr:sigma-70 family RNA polymerase sigma factor [Planctomycetales bacterium]
MQTASELYREVSSTFERDQLILDHLEYVRQILGKLLVRLPDGVDIENLEAAGTLGLIEAANNFDADRGVEFTTFSYPRIRGAILDELRHNCPLPQAQLQKIAQVRRACETLEPPVTIEAIVAATKLGSEEVEQCLEAIRLTQPEPFSDITSVGGRPRGSHEPAPDYELEQLELRMLVADGIQELDDRERLVVTLYYMEDLRLKEIGEVLGLSESRVSRLLTRGEFNLREYVRARIE